ncbi:MAG: glutathione S-transferase family protein, partial [Mesorhizobium sp.]
MRAAKTYRRGRRFASAPYYRGTMLTLFH